MVDTCQTFTIITWYQYIIMAIFDFSDLSPELRDNLVNKLSDELKPLHSSDRYCEVCGTKLGIDCGDAEPDYDEKHCSVGCYESRHFTYNN